MKKENTICGIYRITSLKKKIYVGQAVDIEKMKEGWIKRKERLNKAA